MAKVYVYTDKTKEAVYEYSTKTKSRDLSLEGESVIKLFYNRGNRQLRYSINNDKEQIIPLMGPKKPDSTPFSKLIPKKGEVKISTDKVKEAIYEYSTQAKPRDLSLEPSVTVMLFYNRGNRQLQIKEGRFLKTINLKGPKKPDSTPFSDVKKKK